MPLVNGSIIVGTVRNFRTCYFEGRYGGGKTALAFRLAYELMEHWGYRYLLTNCRSVWADKPGDVILRPNASGEPQYADTVVVLDEAGLYLRYGRDADDFLAFLRKLNIVLLMPSYEEVARKLAKLRVQRTMNLQVLGLPVWVYGFNLNYGMQKDKSYFYWVKPYEIFGIYDTDATPNDDAGLSDWFLDQKERLVDRERKRQFAEGYRSSEGASRKSERAGIGVPTMEGFERGDADLITDAASEISGSISILEDAISKRRR